MDLHELKSLIEAQGDSWQEFVTKNDDRLKTLEKDVQGMAEFAKKANRPGAPAIGSPVLFNDAEPEGVVTLTAEHLKSREAIATRLNLSSDDHESVRMGEFLRAAAGMKVERKGLSEGTDVEGGYTVPEVLLPGILAALAPASSMTSAGANIVVLEEQAKAFNVAGIASIPTAGWRAERGPVVESEPAFNSLAITPKSLAFYFKVSRELLQDSPGLDAALNTVIGQAFAKAIDRAGLLGSGASPEPLGLANMVGINTVSMGTNGAAIAGFSPFVKARTAIESDDAPTPTAAIMAPRTSGDIAGLVDTMGQPLRRPEALDGWSFQTSSQVPINDTVGTSNDCSRIFVGDFSYFSFYVRENLSIMLLKELFAQTGEVAFVCHARVDAAALYRQAFCVVNGVRPAA